jgi:glycosyltransferase involved in cell wall biosynthesis
MLHATGLGAKLRMGALALCEYNACFLPDELVAVSETTRKHIPMIKRVIPNGVDLSAFAPGNEKSSVPSLLFVGTMTHRKRGAMLLDIFHKQIQPKIPGAEFWAVCEEEVSGKGVRWFGRVSKEKLTDLYRRAWVFCLPSTYEGFGVPYIEAMASGVPVVASPNLGAIEVTQEGRAGLIASDGELGATLSRVLTDAPLRETLTAAGLERSRHFGWDRVCSLYEGLYSPPIVTQRK